MRPIDGFLLVYSTNRRASLAHLAALANHKAPPHVPLLIMAVGEVIFNRQLYLSSLFAVIAFYDIMSTAGRGIYSDTLIQYIKVEAKSIKSHLGKIA